MRERLPNNKEIITKKQIITKVLTIPETRVAKVLPGFDVYPRRTLRYTDASILG